MGIEIDNLASRVATINGTSIVRLSGIECGKSGIAP